MAIERKFVADSIKKMQIKEYMGKELDRAGCGSIDIQRTPMGTRVIVNAQRPGLVIGRKGQAIRKLTNVLKKRYGLDNPQIEVNELQVPELNASVMAESIASSIERGIHFRRAAYSGLRKIMEAGARGAEISISGKLTGERAKSVKFLDGYLKHCGEPAIMYVDKGHSQAHPKPGVLGVRVKIMPPGIKLPDDIVFIDIKKDEVKKVEKTKEGIEELVEDILEEVGIDETSAPKKIKVEQVKRKAAKKKSEDVLDLIEDETADLIEDETAEGDEEKPQAKTKEVAPKKEKVAEVKEDVSAGSTVIEEKAPSKIKAVPKTQMKEGPGVKEEKKAPATEKAPAKKKPAPKKESKSKTDVKDKPAMKKTKESSDKVSESPKEKK